MKSKKLSRARIGNRLLNEKLGYLLNPALNQTKKEIRKIVIKAFKEIGWKSPFNNSYQRGKVYDEVTDKIFNTQRGKLSGGQLRSVNTNLKKWAVKEFEDRKEERTPTGKSKWETLAYNPKDLFNWFEAFDFALKEYPNYLFEANVLTTGYRVRGTGGMVSQKRTPITSQAKMYGYESMGYHAYINQESKEILFEFFNTD